MSLFYKNRINSKILIGSMTTREVDCTINKNKLKISYVDYLCVHKNYRKQGIAEQLIYSHICNAKNAGLKTTVSLFKEKVFRHQYYLLYRYLVI